MENKFKDVLFLAIKNNTEIVITKSIYNCDNIELKFSNNDKRLLYRFQINSNNVNDDYILELIKKGIEEISENE